MRPKYTKWKIQILYKGKAFNLLKFKLYHMLRMENLATKLVILRFTPHFG